MRDKLASIAVAAALAGLSGSACAMSSDQDHASGCRVIGGEKLPAESGGADALCKAITDAAAEQAPGVSYSVEVTVLPLTWTAAKPEDLLELIYKGAVRTPMLLDA